MRLVGISSNFLLAYAEFVGVIVCLRVELLSVLIWYSVHYVQLQVSSDVRSQSKLVPDLQSRLSATRRQLLSSAGTLHRSELIVWSAVYQSVSYQ